MLFSFPSVLRKFSKGRYFPVWTNMCIVLATGVIPVSGWDLPTTVSSQPEGQDTDLATRLNKQLGNRQEVHFLWRQSATTQGSLCLGAVRCQCSHTAGTDVPVPLPRLCWSGKNRKTSTPETSRHLRLLQVYGGTACALGEDLLVEAVSQSHGTWDLPAG